MTGRDQPLKGDEEEVKQATATLKDDPKLRVMVIGRADKRGDAAMNKELSLLRARRVQSLLVAEGVDDDRDQRVSCGAAMWRDRGESRRGRSIARLGGDACRVRPIGRWARERSDQSSRPGRCASFRRGRCGCAAFD